MIKGCTKITEYFLSHTNYVFCCKPNVYSCYMLCKCIFWHFYKRYNYDSNCKLYSNSLSINRLNDTLFFIKCAVVSTECIIIQKKIFKDVLTENIKQHLTFKGTLMQISKSRCMFVFT